MVNTVPSDYITGTITLTNGSAAFTGTGTGWLAMMFRQGDMILDLPDAPEYIAIIDEVTTNTAGTLTRPWLGPTLTGAYRMRYQWDAGRVTAMSAFLREELGNGNLQAFAALVGSAGGVPVFIGPGAMEVRPATDFVNGVAYDVQVDTLADRAAFDGQLEGFAVLVSNVGDGRSALYSKASNTVGDWTDPAYITGPIGAAPAFAAGTTTTVPPGTPADVDLVPDGSGGYLFDFDIPAGEGFVSRGTYSGATAYVKGDVVQNNGSSWVAKIATTGNAPPVLPTVSNTWWELLAAAGMNGTGTGDMIGPASATDGAFVGFDGTTGKLTKEISNTVATSMLNTFAETLKGLVPAPTAPDVAAGKILAADGTWIDPPTGGGGQNDSIFALELADLKGSRLPLFGGIADAFDDQTGVDAGTSTGFEYDAANDWFRGISGASQEIPLTGGSAVVGSTTFTLATRVFTLHPSRVLKSIGVYAAAAGTQTVKIVRRISSTSYEVLQSHDFTAVIGWNDFVLPSPFTVPASGTYHVSSVLYPVNNFTVSAGNRAYANGNAPVGTGTWIEDTGAIIPLRTRYIVENMDLRSVTYTATAQPTTAKIAIQTVETGSVTINTDLIGYVSRDSGTTWQSATLALITSLSGIKMYQSTDIDLSALPSGTSMRWRIRTQNNSDVAASGVVLQWE